MSKSNAWETALLSLVFSNTTALVAGTRYNVEIVATYADGLRVWPEGQDKPPSILSVKAPGDT